MWRPKGVYECSVTGSDQFHRSKKTYRTRTNDQAGLRAALPWQSRLCTTNGHHSLFGYGEGLNQHTDIAKMTRDWMKESTFLNNIFRHEPVQALYAMFQVISGGTKVLMAKATSFAPGLAAWEPNTTDNKIAD